MVACVKLGSGDGGEGGEWEERGREEDSMFSELPMPPVKWR